MNAYPKIGMSKCLTESSVPQKTHRIEGRTSERHVKEEDPAEQWQGLLHILTNLFMGVAVKIHVYNYLAR